ncbi:MAG TPA: PhnD/SsuA/transferrin family substrate-binding protein, partial [Rhodocyclaceae bacterium]|nr:PhnD/SsuA/transferrin family substrate-binding protein [Rhodocyclaceae bacterium]
STYPYVYVSKRGQAQLLAVPLFHGRPYYSGYLIVPASDTHSKSILDLRGKIFAYADPYSFSGWLLPRYQLQRAGESPDHFFRKTFFTHAHSGVIAAVAAKLALGGAVDGFVWESLARQQPELTNATRVVAKSEEFAFPPVIAVAGVSEETAKALQRVLLGMAGDPEGQAALRLLGIDGFVVGDPAMYKSVVAIMQAMGGP